MLSIKNIHDQPKMMKYYRTSDMLNLLYFFPQLSPIRDLTIVESKEEYLENKDFLHHFSQNRVDTLKGRPPIVGIENSGKENVFYETLVKVKEKDPLGVLVLFNLTSKPTERYERWAGISVGVNLGISVLIEAVSRGFDGREVSKNICTHERINFLKSIGLEEKVFSSFIPEEYQPIPDFIWLSVIRNLLKQLEKKEDLLAQFGFTNFAISGHTEGREFAPWQMFDKNRYTLLKKK